MVRAQLGWIGLLVAASWLSACGREQPDKRVSDVVVVASATDRAGIVLPAPRIAVAKVTALSSLATRDAALQHAADSTASCDYPDLAPDRLEMANEPIAEDGQA